MTSNYDLARDAESALGRLEERLVEETTDAAEKLVRSLRTYRPATWGMSGSWDELTQYVREPWALAVQVGQARAAIVAHLNSLGEPLADAAPADDDR